MSFSFPWALLLLPSLPLFWIVAWSRRSRLHHGRETAGLVVRSLIILLIVLALAGSQQVQVSNDLATVFLLDVSDSVSGPARETGLTYIRQALTAMGPEDRTGLILFGADALVEQPVSANPDLGHPASVPIKNYTDIAGAIRLGLTLFPEDAARRLVLLSDGRANLGNARQAAQVAGARGVELSVVPLPFQTGADVRLEALTAPSTLHAGEHFDLTINVHSTATMDVPLQVFSQGRVIARQNLSLQAGENAFILPLVAGEPGFTTFQARLAPPVDTFPQNNALDAFSQVQGPLSILLVAEPATVAGQIGEGEPLAAALRGTGLAVTEISPAEMPSDLGRLSEFAAVVLVNIPGFKLAPRQLELLQTYVRDLGHGLVVVGGEASYGPGGYFQTPLEETLPLDMTIEDKQRLPGMTLLTVIDKSGSMSSAGTQGGGARKVELAKEAIYRSVDLLVPWDRIGVIAFDNAGRWVQEPVPAVNIQSIKNAVGTIRASGGTDILAGLQLAAETITKEPSQVRHIVLLTDGGANPAGIPELTQNLAEQGVTISVVAIGQGYAPFLEEVADIGGGRFHFAADAGVIPQIFAQETSLASRSYLVEETFRPRVVNPSPILHNFTELPALQGYVATSPKLTAQIVLRGGPEQDPILAQWQYGLGRAVAWTSDAKGQWAANWLTWPDFPRFWAQAVRWTIVEGSDSGLESQVRLEGDRAIVAAEVLAADGSYRNNLEVTLNLVDPDLKRQTLPLRQTAPGLYEGAFRPQETGPYLLHIAGQEPAAEQNAFAEQSAPADQREDTSVAVQARGFVMTYSPEYQTTRVDSTLLPDLATIGHGRVLSLESPAEAFAHTLPPARGTTDLWPWFLTAAIVLLPLDVGLRRIIFDKKDLQRAWIILKARLPQSRTTSRPQVSSAGRLLRAKFRQREKTLRETEPIVMAQIEPVSDIHGPTQERTAGSTRTQFELEPVPEAREESTVRRLMRVKQKRRASNNK